METKLTRKMWSVISLAIVLALVFAPLALADNLVGDADALAINTPHPSSISATQAGGTTAEYDLSAYIKLTGAEKNQVFLKTGDTVEVTIKRSGDWLDGGDPGSFFFTQYDVNKAGKIGITVPCGSEGQTKTMQVILSAGKSYNQDNVDDSNGNELSPDSVTLYFIITAGPDGDNCATPDEEAPVAYPTQSPAANTDGWNNTDVTIYWNWEDEDDGSGIDEDNCTTETVVTEEGKDIKVTATCSDLAGNEGTATYYVSIDKTAPTVALVDGPVGGGVYYFGFVPAAPTCTASDALSGLVDLDNPCSVDGYYGTVGTHTVTASATDIAGNSATVSHTYTVLDWEFKGFYQPVDMDEVYNTVKNGSTVPMKFEIFVSGNEVTETSKVKMSAKQVPCANGGDESAITISATGGTSLRYDLDSGQFVYNWQTPKPAAGLGYAVTATYDSAPNITAYFKLK